MSIDCRRYMPASLWVDQQAGYAWDEWRSDAHFKFTPPEGLFQRLDRLTNKANLGLTIATAEWGVFSLSRCTDISLALQFIEAAWAGAIHSGYLNYTEFDVDHWRGPVRGPLYLFMLILNDAVHELRSDPRIASRACWAFNLANHIIPDSPPFLSWWNACVSRMEALHTEADEFDPAETPDIFEDFPNQGMPVPPQAFDPGFPYDRSMAASLWDDYLVRLMPASNRFLAPPERLSELDFLPSPPYRYLKS